MFFLGLNSHKCLKPKSVCSCLSYSQIYLANYENLTCHFCNIKEKAFYELFKHCSTSGGLNKGFTSECPEINPK